MQHKHSKDLKLALKAVDDVAHNPSKQKSNKNYVFPPNKTRSRHQD